MVISPQARIRLMRTPRPIFGLMLMLISSIGAAQIQVELSHTTLEAEQSFTAKFTLMNSSQQLPSPEAMGLDNNFDILNTRHSRSTQIINGEHQSLATLEIDLMPKRSGKLTIPSVQVGNLRSQAKQVTVKPARKQSKPSQDFYIDVTATPKNPYVQQEVKFTFKIFMAHQVSGNISPPKVTGNAVIKPLHEAKKYQLKKGGKLYRVYEQTYMIYPQESGRLDILPLTLKGNYVVKRKRYSLKRHSSKIRLDVRPVPKAFTGSYWLPARKLEISASWSGDLSAWQQGEAYTRNIQLTGHGLLATQMPEIEVPGTDNFNIYANRQPQKKNVAAAKGFVGERTQQIVFIPLQTGTHEFAEIKIPWWNTRTEKMEYVILPAADVEIQEAAFGNLVMEDSADVLQDEFDFVQASGGVYSIWVWLTVVFGSGWLATVLFLSWRYYLSRSQRSILRRRNEDGIRQCRKRVKNACLENDAAAASRALLQWGSVIWKDNPPIALGQLAERGSRDFSAEIKVLEQALYGQETGWKGALLWDIFSHEAVAEEKIADTDITSLEPLHRL